MNIKVVLLAVTLLTNLVAVQSQAPAAVESAGSAELTSGWALRSANGLSDTGAVISQPGYNTAGWSPIALPTTVLAGLVANNVYQNIYFGTNLQSVPDLTTQDWWYRGEFDAPIAIRDLVAKHSAQPRCFHFFGDDIE